MKQILLVVTVLSYFYRTYSINWGKQAYIKDFNYVVGILIHDSNKPFVQCVASRPYCTFCTGGILHEKFILTAAHCFCKKEKVNEDKTSRYYIIQNKKVLVYANNDNLYKDPEEVPIKRIGKEVYFISEFFETGLDDIAILKLNYGLYLENINKDVLNKITLPYLAQPHDHKISPYKSYDDALCVIAGFGQDKRSVNTNIGSLKTMHSQIFPLSQCHSYERDKFLFGQAVKQNGCRPIHPLGSCIGDSGAPVVLLDSPGVIVGLVTGSFNYKCDSRSKNSPEMYMRITSYTDFIDHVISSKPSRPEYTLYKFSYLF